MSIIYTQFGKLGLPSKRAQVRCKTQISLQLQLRQLYKED